MTTTESTLLARLRQGEPQAVARWFKLYAPKLERFLARSLNQPSDIEELVQETFINCLKHLTLFRGDSSLWTWMQSIARHEIADYYRKRYAKKAIRALPLSELLVGEAVGDAHETAEKVKAALKKLSGESQELLWLKYVDGQKVAEIAHQWGRSVKSIESELFRARRAFKVAYAAGTP